MDNEAIRSRWEIAEKLALAGGKKTLEYFQSDFSVEKKDDDSPVTIADREAEQLIRKGISEAFPEDAILGEEFGETAGTSGYRWILDPIDGTKSFICGVPLYATMVAVEFDKESVIGVIAIPGLGEWISAAKGMGAKYYEAWDAKPTVARCGDTPDIADAIFVTSQVDTFGRRNAEHVYLGLQEKAYITRTWGDAYGYLLVATGRADIMVDPMMSVWDAAALQPVIEEANGCFLSWEGNRDIYSGDAVATTPHLKDEVLQIIQG